MPDCQQRSSAYCSSLQPLQFTHHSPLRPSGLHKVYHRYRPYHQVSTLRSFRRGRVDLNDHRQCKLPLSDKHDYLRRFCSMGRPSKHQQRPTVRGQQSEGQSLIIDTNNMGAGTRTRSRFRPWSQPFNWNRSFCSVRCRAL